MFKRRLAYILCVVLLVTSISVPVAAEQTGIDGKEAVKIVDSLSDFLLKFARDPGVSYGSLYKPAFEKILEENPESLESALHAMLESIDDYSEYYNKEEKEKILANVSGELVVGIGVTIDFTDTEKAVIASVIPDTPAEKAGIQVGDVLVSADGQDLRGMKSELLLELIRGEKGVPVKLEVERNGKILAFEMVREEILGESVFYEIIEENNIKVMYIRVHGFIKNTAEKLELALAEADKKKVTNLIIDLRDNGGGIFEQAILMADNFVPKGKIITTQDYKLALLNKTYVGTKVDKNKYKVAIIMNGNSASASEVFAAALRENDEAILIGETSYGKGTVQSLTDLKATDGLIKYTSGYYLTPLGNNINGTGIEPDIYVENRPEKVNPDDYGDFGYIKVYKEGDKGEEVKTAKEILQLFGYYIGEINDVYDHGLFQAVYDFQEKVGVFPYGVLDYTTQLQLHNVLRMIEVVKDEQYNEALRYFGIEID